MERETGRTAVRSIVTAAIGMALLGACSLGIDDRAGATAEPWAATEDRHGARGDEWLYVKEPRPPRELARDDARGAEAAARYFVELFGYLHTGDDSTAWRELSHPDCTFCTGIAETVPVAVPEGQELLGGGFVTIDELEAVAQAGGLYAVTLVAGQTPLVLRDASTKVVIDFNQPQTFEGTVTVAHGDGRWLVHDVVLTYVNSYDR